MAARPPTARLLGDYLPGREALRQMTPRGAGPDGPAQGVEAVMEVGDALTGLFGRQAKGGRTNSQSGSESPLG